MENNEMVTETVKAEQEVVSEPAEKTERMFTRKEMNTAIAEEKRKLREELEAQALAQKSEAEKLANMKESEKQQYALDKASKERDDAMAELNAFKLEKEALKIAEEKGVNSKLLSLIDFTKAKAEDVESQIDNINSIINAEVERVVNERLKESTPKTVYANEQFKTNMPRASF